MISVWISLILVQMTNMDLVSVFCRQISSFPSNIWWGGYLFSIVCFWHLCQKLGRYSCVKSCHLWVCAGATDQCAKWNKTATETHIPHDFILMWNLKQLISSKLRVKCWLTEAGNNGVGVRGKIALLVPNYS
jgi:hypothetical protein